MSEKKPYIERHVSSHFQRLLSMYPAVTVSGPRQSGKTTLVRHLCPEYDYVSMEDVHQRDHFRADPLHFLEVHRAPCIFDEVQNTPDLLSYLQGLIDREDRPGMYVLTGSRQIELQEAVSQSLSGRTGLVDLLPLSQAELRDAGICLTRDEMLLRGGLPRVHAGGVESEFAYADYISTYLERDLRQLVQVRDYHAFFLFLRQLASRVGQVVNLSSLSQGVGVSVTTLQNWLSVLEASYIVFTLYPYYRNFGKRLTKSPKIYFTEPGVVASLLRITTAEQMGRDPLLGQIFENMVVSEALKTRFNAGKKADLYCFRDTRGFEVDLIWDDARRPHPIEIKSGTTYMDSMGQNVRKFAAGVAESAPPALIYGGQASLGEVNGVQVLALADLAKALL